MQPEEVGDFDCGMNWLKPPYRKCLTPVHHRERVMNEAALLEVGYAMQQMVWEGLLYRRRRRSFL